MSRPWYLLEGSPRMFKHWEEHRCAVILVATLPVKAGEILPGTGETLATANLLGLRASSMSVKNKVVLTGAIS